MSSFMDLTTNQIMHFVHLGDAKSIDKVLSSQAIWCCLSCETCTVRCPKEVKPSRIIDALREKAIENDKISEEASNIIKFHKSFLAVIKSTGRLAEFPLILRYKLSSLKLFQDILLAPVMVIKGKLHFMPHKIEGVEEVRKIFEKCGM